MKKGHSTNEKCCYNNNMDFMKEGLNFWVNKNWQTIFSSLETIWYDLGKFLENKHGGTLLVCPIMSHAKQQYGYLVVAIDRPKRTILCTTTHGDVMDKEFFDYVCGLEDHRQLFACVALRLKCEQNHEAFVVYLGDIFSNGKFNPLYRTLSDSQILQQYNINFELVRSNYYNAGRV